MTATFATVTLANGKMELIPKNLVMLNPESQEHAQYLYFVWPFKADAPISFKDVLCSEPKAPLYGYFTDHIDLYKTDRHDEVLSYAHFEELKEDYLDMTKRLLEKIDSLTDDGETWSYAYCLCDCLGREVQIGTSHGFTKVTRHE